MVGTFELVAAHLAFDRAGVGTQPALGQPLGNDLGDRPPDRAGDLVRGKTPRGWPGGGARSLKFRRYAAVAWLVEAGASNRAGVSWAAVFPVIRARRKAMIMSSTDTCRLCRYHGAAWRRELRSAAGRPARSCHRTRMVRLARPRGVVRWTAAGSRFWASPAPRRSLPSLIDCSTDQREAYLATICPPGWSGRWWPGPGWRAWSGPGRGPRPRGPGCGAGC